MNLDSTGPGDSVVVLGSGGREHALAWKLAQSPRVGRVLVLPGNDGITALVGQGPVDKKIRLVPIETTDVEGIIKFTKDNEVKLVVPGPELPLVSGLADVLRSSGIAVFGPSARAAMATEGSKCKAKEFMARHGIPTAPFRCFSPGEEESARAYIIGHDLPVVVKDDGLAAGKGVTIARTIRQPAIDAALRLLGRGRRIVVERYLPGRELSFTCLVVGDRYLPLAVARDHKLLKGKMTGGMGVVSSDDLIGAELYQRILDLVVRPTVRGLVRESAPFVGFLYFGLMIVGTVPYVLEFNCRLGDPEAQAILFRLWSDFYMTLQTALRDSLSSLELRWNPEAAVCVVMAAAGYPGEPRKGDRIRGLEAAMRVPGVRLFSAAMRQDEHGALFTDGGRVLNVVATGPTVVEARHRAYTAAGKIRWAGRQMVHTIGLPVG